MRSCFWLPLAFLLAAAPVAAVTPHLVKDIDPTPRPESSSPHTYENVAGLVYFTADDGQTGDELWRTDGTSGGTFRLTDACPGDCSSWPFFVGQSDRLYFFQVTGASGQELWVTDGTPGGTFFLTSAVQFPAFGRWVASQRLLYFSADDGIHGVELWRTDGTPAGTFLVSDVPPGILGSGVKSIAVFNGKIFFQAFEGRGPSLWASDGTPSGTRLGRNLAPSQTLQDQQPFFGVVGNLLVFTGPTPSQRLQLWRSDGTAKGTYTLTSFKPRSGSITTFLRFLILKNRLLFMAATKGPGLQLWTTDGTA